MLRDRIASSDAATLAGWWPRLEPLHKAAAFKLMPASRALEFYHALPSNEKYFLLCAFDIGTIAPILETAAPKIQALFHRLTEDSYEAMYRELSR